AFNQQGKEEGHSWGPWVARRCAQAHLDGNATPNGCRCRKRTSLPRHGCTVCSITECRATAMSGLRSCAPYRFQCWPAQGHYVLCAAAGFQLGSVPVETRAQREDKRVRPRSTSQGPV